MERLDDSKDVAAAKLLILYMLSKLDAPIGGVELIRYILEERLFDYLTFQQRFHELVDAGCIDGSPGGSGVGSGGGIGGGSIGGGGVGGGSIGGGGVGGGGIGSGGVGGGNIGGGGVGGGGVGGGGVGGATQYIIARAGTDLLAEMGDLIPPLEKNRVDRTAAKLARRILEGRSVTAEYIPDDERGGVVQIALNEGGLNILNLSVAVASPEEARLISNNWKTGAADIYPGIIRLLMEPHPPYNRTARHRAAPRRSKPTGHATKQHRI